MIPHVPLFPCSGYHLLPKSLHMRQPAKHQHQHNVSVNLAPIKRSMKAGERRKITVLPWAARRDCGKNILQCSQSLAISCNKLPIALDFKTNYGFHLPSAARVLVANAGSVQKLLEFGRSGSICRLRPFSTAIFKDKKRQP